jgi:DNA-binding transcriptional MerR regulator
MKHHPDHISQAVKMVDRVFGTKEVARLTGTTLRDIQWWCEAGFLVPRRGPSPDSRCARPGGSARIFTADDVRLVWLIARLRESLSMQQARRVIPFLREKEGFLLIEVTAHGCRPRRYPDEDQVIRASAQSDASVLVVDLGAIG